MKYNNFKKNIKKEFKENYNDEKKEKNKSSISIWIKLIPVYSLALLAILLVFILTAQRNPSYITEFDKNIELYSEDSEYKELKKVSSEEIQNYRNYLKYKENKEKTKNIWDIDLIFGNKDTASETSGGANQEFTSIDTNNQEEGVIEADIAKFDGTYFYYTISYSFVIYDLSGNKLLTETVGYNSKLEIYGNKIIIYNYSKFNIYSFDGEKLTNLYKLEDETIEETRLVDNYLYLVSARYEIKNDDTEIYYDQLNKAQRIVTISKINLDNMESSNVKVASTYDNVIYMNNTHIVFSNSSFINSTDRDFSLNSVFDIDLNPVGVFICDGSILDQYSIDVYQNQLRMVSTTRDKKNILTIFDLKEKNVISKITEGIGLKNEIVKSVTFTDTKCFVVTYVQTDPLYEIDLTDPKNPVIVDALKVDGYSSYLKTFTIQGIEYIFGAGVINNNLKYSVYKNDDTNTQVGYDYTIMYSDANYQDYYENSCAINPHAMRFFQKNDILYLFAPVGNYEFTIYSIDVSKSKDQVITRYKNFDTNTETRLFLYNGICYLPQLDKLIIDSFIDEE